MKRIGIMLILWAISGTLQAADVTLKDFKITTNVAFSAESGEFAEHFVAVQPAVEAGFAFEWIGGFGSQLSFLHHRKELSSNSDSALRQLGFSAKTQNNVILQTFFYQVGLSDTLSLNLKLGAGHNWAHAEVIGPQDQELSNEYWILPRWGGEFILALSQSWELTAGYQLSHEQDTTTFETHFFGVGLNYIL